LVVLEKKRRKRRKSREEKGKKGKKTVRALQAKAAVIGWKLPRSSLRFSDTFPSLQLI
jgi:hypothetical protein